ncbi:MAG: hypothetical protein DRK00_06170 [Thermoprotei archaeon]|nr:MAG: hypothetical protein DRK00_06170 [Thermoprotei archaeon]
MALRASDVTVVALCAAFWSVLNATLAPIFWRLTHLPFFCDLLAVVSLMLGVWWVRRLGTATLIGIIATALNFAFRPGAVHFLGFTAASIVFDLLTRACGYGRCFSPKHGPALLLVLGTASTWVAGLVIGAFFMGGRVPVLTFSLLHAAGGLMGSAVGLALIRAVEARGVKPIPSA